MRRISSETLPASEGLKGGVSALFRSVAVVASISIWPVASLSFAFASRMRHLPSMEMTSSLRKVLANSRASGLSGWKTICVMPSRSRRSMKMTPPWSR